MNNRSFAVKSHLGLQLRKPNGLLNKYAGLQAKTFETVKIKKFIKSIPFALKFLKYLEARGLIKREWLILQLQRLHYVLFRKNLAIKRYSYNFQFVLERESKKLTSTVKKILLASPYFVSHYKAAEQRGIINHAKVLLALKVFVTVPAIIYILLLRIKTNGK